MVNILYPPKDDLVSFNIFQKLLELTFSGKMKTKKICHIDVQNFKVANLSFLLAWPAILEMELAIISGNMTYKKKLETLKKLLNSDANHSTIRENIENLITVDPPPKYFRILALLYNPETINRNFQNNFFRLIHYLGTYYIFCFMIANYYSAESKEEASLNFKDMGDIFKKCKLSRKTYIYVQSRMWLDELVPSINEDISFFNSVAGNKEKLNIFLTKTFDCQSMQLFFREVYMGECTKFAFVTKYENSNHKHIGPLGMATNLSLDFNFNYDLWYMRFSKKISGLPSNGYFFFKDNRKNQSTNFLNLVFWLNRMAMYSASIMKDMIDSWDDLLDDSKDAISSNTNKYKNLVSSILKRKEIRDEFFKFKGYSKVVGDADTEVFHEDIQEARKLYKDAKFHHIPIDLEEKLLDADKELREFVNLIIRKINKSEEGLGDSDKLLEYYKSHKDEYKYLKLLNEEDFKRIIFGNSRNVLRNNRRIILSIINKKLGGREFQGMSTLTKKLGLESGDATYLKWSK
jgi:hypothetical protein